MRAFAVLAGSALLMLACSSTTHGRYQAAKKAYLGCLEERGTGGCEVERITFEIEQREYLTSQAPVGPGPRADVHDE